MVRSFGLKARGYTRIPGARRRTGKTVWNPFKTPKLYSTPFKTIPYKQRIRMYESKLTNKSFMKRHWNAFKGSVIGKRMRSYGPAYKLIKRFHHKTNKKS